MNAVTPSRGLDLDANDRTTNGLVLHGRFIRSDELLNATALADVEVLRERFVSAKPYPHLEIDGLFSGDLLDRIVSEFDEFGEAEWKQLKNEREQTLRLKPGWRMKPASKAYLDLVSSPDFVRFLSSLTGIPALLPDPLLRGGGLHESKQGGHFGLHLDFAKHPVTKLDNRVVMITYLNRDWREDYGGCLEIWDMDNNKCVHKVVPQFGRTIFFAHSDKSLHGHPVPVSAPEGRPRRSIAAYYYSNGREDDAAAERYTTFFAPSQTAPRQSVVKQVVRAVSPPILLWAGSRLVNALGGGPKGR
jgi:hypothetical protein